MKTITTVTLLCVALLAFVACDSKVEAARRAEELEKKAVIAHEDAKIFAAKQARQAAMDADAAKARAEAERKNAEALRSSVVKPSKAPEGKVSEPEGQK